MGASVIAGVNAPPVLPPDPEDHYSCDADCGEEGMGGLLPVSRTQSLGVMMEPEVAYGTQGIQPRVQA